MKRTEYFKFIFDINNSQALFTVVWSLKQIPDE